MSVIEEARERATSLRDAADVPTGGPVYFLTSTMRRDADLIDRLAYALEVAEKERDALIQAANALETIRQRIPYDAENEDENGWGKVDAALERIGAIRAW